MAPGYSLIVFAGIFLLQSALAAEHWSYPDLATTDVFPKWGGVCDNGQLQSPIDLSISGSLKGSYPELEFHNYEKILSSPSLVNNGHSVQLSQFSVQMALSGGPLINKYIVEQIHFHWWSEHTLEKLRYPMEAHIVHRNKRYDNFTEAVKHKDGVVVIGVLFYASNEANSGIGKIAENLEFIKDSEDIDKAVTMEQKLNVRELFPNLSSGYMTYQGSLTTPSCAEAVTWFVLLDTFPVTLEQVNKFKDIETQGGAKLTNNYREIQKKNNRAVIVVQDLSRSMAAPSVSSSLLAVMSSIVVVYLRRML